MGITLQLWSPKCELPSQQNNWSAHHWGIHSVFLSAQSLQWIDFVEPITVQIAVQIFFKLILHATASCTSFAKVNNVEDDKVIVTINSSPVLDSDFTLRHISNA